MAGRQKSAKSQVERQLAAAVEQSLTSALPAFRRLSAVAASLIESLLQSNGIEYLSVTHRTKSIEGCLEKIRRKDYHDPEKQLTDRAGIRIIVYLEDQVLDVANVLEDAFVIDAANSSDRQDTLGRDRVGYRSVHYVCQLGQGRGALPEYDGLGDLPFEVQVRTVLQHAWAELAHDSTFKFDVALPEHIQRKVNLHAAMLEIVDGAFQEIHHSIEEYTQNIRIDRLQKRPNAAIDSLIAEKLVERIAGRNGVTTPGPIPRHSLEEAIALGFDTVGTFESLFSEDFFRSVLRHKSDTVAKGALLRLVLLYNRFDEYCQAPRSWVYLTPSTYSLVRDKYGGRADGILKRHGIEIRSLDQVRDEVRAEMAQQLDARSRAANRKNRPTAKPAAKRANSAPKRGRTT